ncbi:hypothetical protein C8R41DRAFT_981163 [Lentinula lateritia]|uniref:DUF6533 domain-containing protein n=1 Tax=Lentinula lateritia TaxID=40482 RepID=A0ABQ8VFW5_9AGAR|nr:hypothetical protein C8R41DRAFT_981163 [Lentinula lateritia]
MSSPLLYSLGLENALLHTQWHGYSEVTATTLLLWDYILTFQSELELIWGRPKNGVTFLFLTNRYLAVVAQLVTTYAHVSSNVTYEVSVFAIAYWLIGTSILQLALTDGIVWLSVCSLYCNTSAVRWPLLGLMITCMLCGVSVVGVVGSHSKGAAQLAPGFKQCTVYTQYHNLWLFWVPLLVYETTTFILVIRLFIQYRRNRKEWTSNLLELLLNDMLLYLAIIFIAFIGNAILFANPDPTLSGILDPPTVVLLSILGNHMLLNLRAESKRAAQGMIYQSGVRDPGTPGPGLGITGTGLETMAFTTATV